jgi:hypothetical protein
VAASEGTSRVEGRQTSPDQEAKPALWAVPEHRKGGTIATQLDLHTDPGRNGMEWMERNGSDPI